MRDRVSVADTLGRRDTVRVVDTVPEALRDADTVWLSLRVTLSVRLSLRVTVSDRVRLRVPLADPLLVRVADREWLVDRVHDSDLVKLDDRLSDADGDGRGAVRWMLTTAVWVLLSRAITVTTAALRLKESPSASLATSSVWCGPPDVDGRQLCRYTKLVHAGFMYCGTPKQHQTGQTQPDGKTRPTLLAAAALPLA